MTLPISMTTVFLCLSLILTLTQFSSGSSNFPPTQILKRTPQPYFPDYPPSCQLCARAYPNISSCAAAAYVFQNASQIIWDPSGFISVIECACTDTFQSAYPQCVDCFQQTNQTALLQSNDLPSVVSGMRTVCGLVSTLLGGVASTNRQLPSETPITVAPSASASRAQRTRNKEPRTSGLLYTGLLMVIAMALGIRLLIV